MISSPSFGSTNHCCRETAVFLIAITESLLYEAVRGRRISKETAHDVIVTVKEEAAKQGYIH